MNTTGDARPTDVKAGHRMLVIQGFLDGAHNLATAVGSPDEPPGITAAFVPPYSGVGDPSKVGIDKLCEEASNVLVEGNEAEVLRILSRVVDMDPQAAAAARLDLILGGNVIGQVSLDAARRSVSVLVHPDRLKAANSFAVIEFPGENPPSPMRRQLVPVDGASYLLAEFESLPDGRFVLGLEFPDF